MARYDDATRAWYAERAAGGIEREVDDREKSMGVRYKAATPAGAAVLMLWQRAHAELHAAAANRRRELGGRR